MSNAIHAIGNFLSKPHNQGLRTLGISKGNTLGQIVDPMAAATNRVDGKPITPGNAFSASGDPANLLGSGTKVSQRAADNSTRDANNAAILAATPSAPTYGQAQKGAQTQDEFLRRRRGILANMVGGGFSGSTSAKTALGQ